jgi:hypothetical protein
MHQITRHISTTAKIEKANKNVDLLLRVRAVPANDAQLAVENDLDFGAEDSDEEINEKQTRERVKGIAETVEKLKELMVDHIKREKNTANITKRSIKSIGEHIKRGAANQNR